MIIIKVLHYNCCTTVFALVYTCFYEVQGCLKNRTANLSESVKLEWIREERQTAAKKRKEEESGTCCNTERTNCPSHSWRTSFQSHTANQQQLQQEFPSEWKKIKNKQRCHFLQCCKCICQKLIDTCIKIYGTVI